MLLRSARPRQLGGWCAQRACSVGCAAPRVCQCEAQGGCMVVVLRAVVVNFYAPWCPWCQRLEPTWEAVTQEVHQKYPDSDGRIRFAKARARAHPCHYHCCAATATQQCRHALCAQPLAPCNALVRGMPRSGCQQAAPPNGLLLGRSKAMCRREQEYATDEVNVQQFNPGCAPGGLRGGGGAVPGAPDHGLPLDTSLPLRCAMWSHISILSACGHCSIAVLFVLPSGT